MRQRLVTRFCRQLFVCASLLLISLPGVAKEAERKVEPRKELPCWYLFMQTGKAPERVLYIVDARYTKISDNVYQSQALVVRETPRGDFDHWSGTLQYQASPDQVALAQGPVEALQPLLKSVQVRTLSGYQMGGDGKVTPSRPTEWGPFQSPVDLLGFRIATDPKAMDFPEKHTMVFTGNFYRPIDVVDTLRRILPNVKDIK